MNHFTKSLRFKVTLLVITVELLIFSGVGVFYTHRFSQEIDNAIIARLSVPALLMSRGELSFEAVGDKRTMEGLLREPYSEGIVIGLDGQVYFSSNPARLETHLDVIDGLRLPGPESSTISVGAPDVITPVQDSTGTYLTCLSPLRPDGKLTGYLYLKVGTAISEAEKRKVSLLFAFGSLATIAFTVPILSWLLHLMVIGRLNYLVEIFRRFARGDYAARAQASGSEDEIGTLMNGFNGLAKRLEETLAHLSESETLLNATQRLSKVGGWEFDVKSGKSFWTEELYRIHEIPNDPGIDHVKESLACYRPEDGRILNNAFQRACEQGEPYDLEFPFTTCTGRPLWVRTTAQPVHEEGKVVRLVGNLMDITERKRAEQVLRENEHFLETLLENIPNMMFVKDARTLRFLRFNTAGEKLLGYSRDELLGKNDHDFFPKEQADFFTSQDREIIDSRELRDIPEEPIDTRYSGQRLLHTIKIPILAENGTPLYLLGISEDITGRKRTEEALRSSEAELRTLISAMTDVIFVGNSEGRYLKIVETNSSILYRPSNELVGKTLHEVFPKEQADFFLSHITQALKTQKPVNFEYSLPIGNRVLWFNATISPMSDEMILMVARDITDRKQAEQALLDNRQRMDNIIANSPGAIFRCANDREWTMEFLSAAINRITGYPADDFLNNRVRSYASIIHPDDRRAVEEAVSAGLERKDRYEIDYRLVARDGTPRWVHEQGLGVFAPDGRLLCLDGVIFDITDQKKAEEQIRKLNQELEQRVAERTAQLEAANKELEAFSYSVSHDLRTPLRAIDGFSHILLEDYRDKLDDEGKRLLNVVRDNTNRMGQLIDDILKFSRAGRLEINFSEIDMEQMARSVFAELRPSAADSKLQLEIEPLPSVTGDGAMLRQVFVNLLSNAIKFSRNREVPKIQVGATVKDGETQYFVKDNGAGFDMQYADKLFGVFQRLHSVNEFEGTGIGLAIVKRIITRHGGRVWAEGKVGEGATLYFSLPTGGKIGKA